MEGSNKKPLLLTGSRERRIEGVIDMRWEVDYTDDDIIRDDLDYEIPPETVEEYEQSKKAMMDYLDQYYSQFIEKQNPKKENQIKWFYQLLAEMAFVNSGRAVLNIDEEKRAGTLKYMGKTLLKTCEENDKTGLIVALIFYTYDFVSIENGEDYFTISIYENLYDKIKVNDKSSELDKIKQDMQRRNRERYEKRIKNENSDNSMCTE